MYGFARLNMTPTQLAAIVFKDPFTRYYTTAYTQTLKTNEKVLTQYINQTLGQPINDFSEYLAMSEFFQTVLEPLVGVITVLLFSSTLRCEIHCVLPVGGGGWYSPNIWVEVGSWGFNTLTWFRRKKSENLPCLGQHPEIVLPCLGQTTKWTLSYFSHLLAIAITKFTLVIPFEDLQYSTNKFHQNNQLMQSCWQYSVPVNN